MVRRTKGEQHEIRRALVLGLVAGALVVSGCSTSGSSDTKDKSSTAAAPVKKGDIRT